jgi:hypothetical protein
MIAWLKLNWYWVAEIMVKIVRIIREEWKCRKGKV